MYNRPIKPMVVLVTILMLAQLTLASCGPSPQAQATAAAQAQATSVAAAQAAATAQVQATLTAEAQAKATAYAQATALANAQATGVAIANATSTAQAQQAAATAAAQATATAQAEATATAQAQATATAQAQATATAEAQATGTAQALAATARAALPTSTPKPPSTVAPTKPPSEPGIDLIAVKGKETCVNKFVSVSYPWEGETDPNGRKMFYHDQNWSVYLGHARPNIKLQTAKSSCNTQKQCNGLTADFCVWVSADAPSNETTTTVLTLIIFSAYPNGTGQRQLATVKVPFTWRIQ